MKKLEPFLFHSAISRAIVTSCLCCIATVVWAISCSLKRSFWELWRWQTSLASSVGSCQPLATLVGSEKEWQNSCFSVTTILPAHFNKWWSLCLPCISNLKKRYLSKCLCYPSPLFLLLRSLWMDSKTLMYLYGTVFNQILHLPVSQNMQKVRLSLESL